MTNWYDTASPGDTVKSANWNSFIAAYPTGSADTAILVADGTDGHKAKASAGKIASDGTLTAVKIKSSIKWSAITALYDLPIEMGGTGADIGYQKMTNGIINAYLEYRNSNTQYAFFEGVFDKDWDGANLTAIIRWYTTSASTNNVQWKLYGARYTDGASRDMTLSSLLATITQANQGALAQNVTTETSTFTLTGTGRNFVLMLTRTSGGSDTLAANARFVNMEIYDIRTLA
jgi:hypothetical protein